MVVIVLVGVSKGATCGGATWLERQVASEKSTIQKENIISSGTTWYVLEGQ
jgi:hypothetical protein